MEGEIPGSAVLHRRFLYLNRNRNGEGLMIYVRNHILSKMLAKYNLAKDNEAAFIWVEFPEAQVIVVRNILHTLPK